MRNLAYPVGCSVALTSNTSYTAHVRHTVGPRHGCCVDIHYHVAQYMLLTATYHINSKENVEFGSQQDQYT